MAATYDRLVAAGAPAIEEPLFFRVSPAPKRDALLVTLRKRSTLRSEVLASRFVYLAGLPAAEVDGAIVSAMLSAVDEIQPHLAHRAAVAAVLGGNLRPTPPSVGADVSPVEEPVLVEAPAPAPRNARAKAAAE